MESRSHIHKILSWSRLLLDRPTYHVPPPLPAPYASFSACHHAWTFQLLPPHRQQPGQVPPSSFAFSPSFQDQAQPPPKTHPLPARHEPYIFFAFFSIASCSAASAASAASFSC